MLDKFRKVLLGEDRERLVRGFAGRLTPDETDPFPRMYQAGPYRLQGPPAGRGPSVGAAGFSKEKDFYQGP